MSLKSPYTPTIIRLRALIFFKEDALSLYDRYTMLSMTLSQFPAPGEFRDTREKF